MTELGTFFRKLADLIDANGGRLPADLMGIATTETKQPVTNKRKSKPGVSTEIQAIINKKLFGINHTRK